ncbi:MAG TPA: alcohol dehydrogenase, partial [Clostridiales bacterium]|nr:alcohol dehydrogenase [Clostridiales bacterium]
KFFVPKIISNKRNNAQITWLTNRKAMLRFLTARFRKDRLIPG